MFKTLEGISDITVVYDGNKTYQLKKSPFHRKKRQFFKRCQRKLTKCNQIQLNETESDG
ncbi:conserved domain protein [Bacteroides fluxus YIT 12057]|uniref:Conserved domain protein n=1 Tax=Bacteroides fluxus YIT 12057 TaxID=763034 RepID=F3PTF5_9BACE|nr:conserved domain protein [Bacteroides fluxus YIT 12057]